MSEGTRLKDQLVWCTREEDYGAREGCDIKAFVEKYLDEEKKLAKHVKE